jgi:hypothetical protein
VAFPILVAAIRSSGFRQWQIAEFAGMPETRLSRICRRGVATPEERRLLSQLLSIDEMSLFAAGPAVDRQAVERCARKIAAARRARARQSISTAVTHGEPPAA